MMLLLLMMMSLLVGGWRRKLPLLGCGVMMMMVRIMGARAEEENFQEEKTWEDPHVTKRATAACSSHPAAAPCWNHPAEDPSLPATSTILHSQTFSSTAAAATGSSTTSSSAIININSTTFSGSAAASSCSSTTALAASQPTSTPYSSSNSIQGDQGLLPPAAGTGISGSPADSSNTATMTHSLWSSSRDTDDNNDNFIPMLNRAWLDWQPEELPSPSSSSSPAPRWETKIIRPGDRVGLHAVRKFLGHIFQEAELGTRFLLDVIPAEERERVAEDIMAFPVFEVVHMGGAALCILYRDEDAPPLVVSAENAGDADSSDSSPNPSPTDQKKKKKRRLSPDEELQNRLAGCILVTEHDPATKKVSGWWQNTRATLVEWWTFVFLWRDTGRPSFEHHPRLYEVDETLEDFESHVHEQYGPQERHVHVRLIGVDPRLQGQGLGRRIMDVVHQVADAAGRPVYLEAVGTGLVRWYQRLGYQSQVVLSVQDPGDAAHELTDYHLLVRPPAARPLSSSS